jgi:hypothetical protein
LKKAEAKVKSYGLAEATKLFNLLKIRDKLLEEHEKAFSKAVLSAYEKGVKDTTLIEFLKDPKVADAKKALDVDRRLLGTELDKLEEYCLTCKKLADDLDKLLEIIFKVVKATAKDTDAVRKVVVKMAEPLTTKLKDLNEAAQLRFRVDKYLTSFDAQYEKFLPHLLTITLKKVDDKKSDLPQPLTDKKLLAASHTAEETLDKLKQDLKEALADKDPKSASLLMKHAEIALAKLTKARATYEKVQKDFKKEIAGSKEKKDIEAKIKTILSAGDEGEKLLKAALAERKKMA